MQNTWKTTLHKSQQQEVIHYYKNLSLLKLNLLK